MSKSANIQLALVTCPRARAQKLAATLVESRVAACVNIIPAVQSIYRWDGKLHKDNEALLLIKTASARFEALKAMVLAHHPYELPEVIAVKVEGGHAPYFDWVLESLK